MTTKIRITIIALVAAFSVSSAVPVTDAQAKPGPQYMGPNQEQALLG